MWERLWMKRYALALLVWMQIDIATVEDVMEIPLKTRNKTTIWPSISNPRHIPWGNQNCKRHIIPLFIASLFTIAKTWKQLTCPSTDECIRKLSSIYTMEYYSAITRNTFESVPVRLMDLKPIIQSEVSQKENNKYHNITCICMESKKKMVLKNLFTG